jgi:hypothetical protein
MIKGWQPLGNLIYCYGGKIQKGYTFTSSEIPLPSDLLDPWDVRELYIRKTADLPLQLWVGTFPRFILKKSQNGSQMAE